MIFGVDHLHEMLIKVCRGHAPGVTFISAHFEIISNIQLP